MFRKANPGASARLRLTGIQDKILRLLNSIPIGAIGTNFEFQTLMPVRFTEQALPTTNTQRGSTWDLRLGIWFFGL